VGACLLAERCLRDADMMSMVVSLEVRAPLVDHRFVESVLAVAGQDRCRGVPDKPFEWELVRPIVTAGYPCRAKRGFLLSFEVWMQDSTFWARVLETLLDRDLASQAGLDPEGAGRLGAAFARPGSDIPWSRIWSVFVLLRWLDRQAIAM
jgi:asparagine synthase (glutamine-hydrolysing)